MNRRTAALLLFLTPAAALAADCPEDSESIAAVPESLIAADNAGDVDRVLEHYTSDVEWITPQGQVLRGKQEIRSRYEALFAGFRAEMAVEIVRVDPGQRFAVLRGRTRGALTPREPGESPRQVDDVFLMVVECEGDGSWRVDRLMWTPSAPGAETE